MSYQILQGDSLSVLRDMPAESIDCCVTSPPYWGLRDYGVDGQIGLESTPDEFVARLVDVFREVRRVLKTDGTCWVNLGDSYNAHSGQRKTTDKAGVKQSSDSGSVGAPSRNVDSLKPKDLCGIPWRVAFALQADGWWLRQDIIWHKPNPMPESVRDRCTKAHEYVFLLTKAERYWWDAEAMKEPCSDDMVRRSLAGHTRGANGKLDQSRCDANTLRGEKSKTIDVSRGRNRRSVWTLATQATPEAHFATFPLELPEMCLRAGCREGGTVLDPFNGAGTTGLVALKNGRKYIGIELNPAYVEITHQRFQKHMPLLAYGFKAEKEAS
jgi:DNA modification methylase